MKIRDFLPVLLAVGALLFVAPAQSATVSLTADSSGFVTSAGGSSNFDALGAPDALSNYSAGWEVHFGDGALGSPTVAMQRKNYFVFDLSSVTGPITSATLSLFNPIGGYESTDASETYEIGATAPGAVPAVLSDLTAIAGVAFTTEVDDPCPTDPLICIAAGLFTSLGDSLGPLPPGAPDPGKSVLASAVMTAASDGTIVDLVFTSIGIDYLNLFAGSTVVLAGGVSTAADGAPSGPGVVPQSVFGFTGLSTTGPTPPALDIEFSVVPLPAGIWLLGSALGLLGWIRRRSG